MENQNMLKYIALIRKEDETDYWIDIPDIPGCVASGENEDEAMINFQEALNFHIEGLHEDNLVLPVPRDKDTVLTEEEDDYLKAYVVEVEDYKAA